MSKENVEIVRHFYDAFAQGDPEVGFAVFDSEVEAYDHDILDAREYRGWAGMLEWQADWERSWESWRWDPEEFIDAGDRVVAVLRVDAKGRHSGVNLERVDGAVWTLRHGKCIRLDYYGSKAEALKAVGLEK